jgi:hypothetical protein
MKTIFRTFGLGAALAALFAVGGISAYGQDGCADVDAMNALYQTVVDNRQATDVPTLQKVVNTSKEFLEKYGNCEVAKQNVDWVKKRLPGWEKGLADTIAFGERKKVVDKYESAVQAKNWDAVYTAGDEFLAKYPNDEARLNFIIPMAWIGFQEVGNKNNKYDANSIKYAKMALDLLKAGTLKPKTSGGYGAFQFECTGREECISFLTYAIGYINYFGENNKQAAMPYYYEASKLPGSFKTNPVVYGTIGDYYFDSVKKIVDELKVKVADQKDTDPDDVKAKKDADIKQTTGMLNGYAERAMDAYSRAYSIAKADPKAKAYADTVYKQIQALYTVRFQKQEGINEWITATVAKPFPDPTSAVTPVIDADASSTTTGGTGTGTAVSNAATTKPIKPRK